MFQIVASLSLTTSQSVLAIRVCFCFIFFCLFTVALVNVFTFWCFLSFKRCGALWGLHQKTIFYRSTCEISIFNGSKVLTWKVIGRIISKAANRRGRGSVSKYGQKWPERKRSEQIDVLRVNNNERFINSNYRCLHASHHETTTAKKNKVNSVTFYMYTNEVV